MAHSVYHTTFPIPPTWAGEEAEGLKIFLFEGKNRARIKRTVCWNAEGIWHRRERRIKEKYIIGKEGHAPPPFKLRSGNATLNRWILNQLNGDHGGRFDCEAPIAFLKEHFERRSEQLHDKRRVSMPRLRVVQPRKAFCAGATSVACVQPQNCIYCNQNLRLLRLTF